ncbi:MAG: hypothetical protein WC139_01690 [Candidatus Kapaibacterium sp.]
MKQILLGLFVFIAFLLLQGCEEEQKRVVKIIDNNNSKDSSSAIIRYDVTGTGGGKITMTRKGGNVKLELEKTVNGQTNLETRFIDKDWIYFYFTTETIVQPVKSRIVKDHNYFSNFAVLSDAEEIASKMMKTGNEIVAGFTCDIYENNTGSKFSVYDSKYVLKASFEGITVTANTVQMNAPIKIQEVEKPAKIEFLELTVAPQ